MDDLFDSECDDVPEEFARLARQWEREVDEIEAERRAACLFDEA